MKHLLLTLDFPPRTGGVARYLKGLADYFGEDMIVISDERQLLSDKHWPHWTEAIRALRSRDDYDHVIVSHILPLGTAAWIAKWFTGKPYSVILHGMDLSLAKRTVWKRFLTKQILSRSNLVITNSKALEREVQETFHLYNTAAIYPPVEGGGWMEPKEGKQLLTVSRLVPRKGHLRVLEALKELPEVQYAIVGSGPMDEEISAYAKAHGLEDRVTLRGGLSDEELAACYRDADLFVMPTVDDATDREGFGMVYLEAALHGLPSVASDLPGVDEAVLQNETGVLVPDGDISALREAISGLLDNTEERRRLGFAAYRRAIHEFRPETQFRRLRERL